MWIAHDDPERPLDYGAWLCCCQRCAVALHALAVQRPGANVVLKSGMDRQVLPAIEVALARVRGNFEDLLLEPDDYLREVFIGSGADFAVHRRDWPSLAPPSAWLPCEECAAS
jgi:hypothetical protein